MARTGLLRLLLVLGLLMPNLAARADEISRADQSAFQEIINDQIAAFNADDGVRAYSHAAPVIKQLFPSPDIFMSMVKQGYQPVYRQKSFSFGEVLDDMGRPSPGSDDRRCERPDLDGDLFVRAASRMEAGKFPAADWCGLPARMCNMAG